MDLPHKLTTTLFIASALAGSAQSNLTLPFNKEGSILDISAHATAAIGTDKGHPTHAHDPNDEVTLQGIELGLNLRANEFIEGFINTNIFLDEEDEFDAEFEEGFLKAKNLKALGGSLELRGGRYLNRLGMQNNIHLHGWNFVDANLTTGLFLGEEGLRTEGIELSWVKDYSAGNFIISTSYGNAIEHSHGEEDEDHSDPGHDHAEETTEKSYFTGELFTVRAQLTYNSNDFNLHTFGINYAHGENGFGRDSSLFSADYLYKWRENGLEAGGKEWMAGVEYFHRDVEWVDEDDATNIGDAGQKSIMFTAGHTFHDDWNLAARYGWVEGVEEGEFETEQRKRLSLALTHQFTLADQFGGHARLQYNHDNLAEGRTEDTLWLQIQFDFGKGEVR